MTNNKSKGDRAEKEIEEILKCKGMAVMRAQRTMKSIFVQGKMKFVSQANDFYGLFDLIAKDRVKTYWIQSKHRNYKNVRDEIRCFMKLNGCKTDKFIQVEKVARKGFIWWHIQEDSEKDKEKKIFTNLKGAWMKEGFKR